jgi:hypothetical protein
MPNFCGISTSSTADHYLITRQTARVNDAEDGYDYSYVQTTVPKRKLKFVFIVNNEDADIKNLKVIKKPTNEALMNWNTTAAGVNVGWEVYTQPDVSGSYGGDYIYDAISISQEIEPALNALATLLGISGLD